jgi:hypothetical protein
VSFEEIIASLRKLDGLAEETAKRAAPLVEEALRATAAAGQAPDGTAWQRRKDGGAPLVHAADAIHVKASGAIVRATLSGPTVWHHYGGGRNPRRPVLPDPGSVPPAVEKALEKAAEQAFAAAVK